MKPVLKNEYDCCPCWSSPADPDEHRGTCESTDGGECRYPGDKEKWEKCQHFVTACKQCGNWWCELNKDYHEKCHISGCKNSPHAIVDDNGVDVPLCEKHATQHFKIMEDIKLQKHDALLTAMTKNIWGVVTHEQIKSWALIERLMKNETKNNPDIKIDELRDQWREIK